MSVSLIVVECIDLERTCIIYLAHPFTISSECMALSVYSEYGGTCDRMSTTEEFHTVDKEADETDSTLIVGCQQYTHILYMYIHSPPVSVQWVIRRLVNRPLTPNGLTISTTFNKIQRARISWLGIADTGLSDR